MNDNRKDIPQVGSPTFSERMRETLQEYLGTRGDPLNKGLTVRDLQEIFGFTTPQAIYKWQHGTAMPAIDNLVVLAAVLNVSIDEIVIVETRELVLASA